MGEVDAEVHVLFVDDSIDDVQLLTDELTRSGLKVSGCRVDDRAGFCAELEKAEHQVIICDWIIPGFGAEQALAIVRERRLDTPFIIVSGQVGEATVVDALRAGAHDFVTKHALARLAPAIHRELREAGVRREQRAAEAALSRAREDFRRIVDLAADPIFILRERYLVYANPAFVAYAGFPNTDAVIGKDIAEVLDPSATAELSALFAEPRDAPVEVLLMRRDGEARTLELSPERPIIFDGARARLMIARDITERRHLETQLVVTERLSALGTLAAGIAHEINNPLVAMTANVEVALEGLSELRSRGAPAGLINEIEQGLIDAREASERVRLISRDLRSFARPEDNVVSAVDVRTVLTSSLRLAHHATKHTGRIVCDYQEVLPVAASELRLGQVFLNLLVNASQAFESSHISDGEIQVSVRMESADRVSVEISDNGPGISEEHIARIFSPFFTTKGSVGTGLGLSISRKIISALGGEIRLVPKPDRGACFRVLLPIAKREHDGRITEPVLTPLKRGRVLVIDDDPLVVNAIQRALSPMHDVDTQSSSSRSLERLKQGERFDLILSDLQVSELGSVDLYQELLDFAPEQAARIAFLTRGVPNEREKNFLEGVPNPHLEKPFHVGELRALIHSGAKKGAA